MLVQESLCPVADGCKLFVFIHSHLLLRTEYLMTEEGNMTLSVRHRLPTLWPIFIQIVFIFYKALPGLQHHSLHICMFIHQAPHTSHYPFRPFLPLSIINLVLLHKLNGLPFQRQSVATYRLLRSSLNGMAVRFKKIRLYAIGVRIIVCRFAFLVGIADVFLDPESS